MEATERDLGAYSSREPSSRRTQLDVSTVGISADRQQPTGGVTAWWPRTLATRPRLLSASGWAGGMNGDDPAAFLLMSIGSSCGDASHFTVIHGHCKSSCTAGDTCMYAYIDQCWSV